MRLHFRAHTCTRLPIGSRGKTFRAATVVVALASHAGAQDAGRTFAVEGEGRAEALFEVAHMNAPSDVRAVAAWVNRSGDHAGLPFLVVDKPGATLYVFTNEGREVAATPVLVGSARGDDSVPGIGGRQIADIRPDERTTPAGRFVAEAGRNLQGEEIVWIDYDAAVSMHRVRATNARERRLQRLATPTPADNRISYGCINVPVAFFDRHVHPLFAKGGRAIVYVLPEVRSLREVFGADAGPWPTRSTHPHPTTANVQAPWR